MTKDQFETICKKDRFYKTPNKELYSLVYNNTHREVVRIHSNSYKEIIEDRLFEMYDTYSENDVKDIIGFAIRTARHKGNVQPLNLRVAEYGGEFYSDLTNNEWQVVRTEKGNWNIGRTNKVLFARNSLHAPQVRPNKPGDISLLEKYIQNVPTCDRLLLMVHIVACFVPEISHAPLVFQSEKGSGKSTLSKMIKQIVDPSYSHTLPVPSDLKDFWLSLENNYMVSFDNLDNIPDKYSSLLCASVTGVTPIEREFYTNSGVLIKELKNCLIINGISLGRLKDDFFDRCILISLKKLPRSKRMSDSDLWSSFNADLPDIMGGIFTILAQAIQLYDDKKTNEEFRFIDYTNWGYAIAEAMGNRGDEFLEALKHNNSEKYAEIAASNLLCVAIVAFTENMNEWTGITSQLLEKLNIVAMAKKLGHNSKYWPENAIALGKQLRKVAPILREIGISVKFKKHNHYGSPIRIRKIGQK